MTVSSYVAVKLLALTGASLHDMQSQKIHDAFSLAVVTAGVIQYGPTALLPVAAFLAVAAVLSRRGVWPAGDALLFTASAALFPPFTQHQVAFMLLFIPVASAWVWHRERVIGEDRPVFAPAFLLAYIPILAL